MSSNVIKVSPRRRRRITRLTHPILKIAQNSKNSKSDPRKDEVGKHWKRDVMEGMGDKRLFSAIPPRTRDDSPGLAILTTGPPPRPCFVQPAYLARLVNNYPSYSMAETGQNPRSPSFLYAPHILLVCAIQHIGTRRTTRTVVFLPILPSWFVDTFISLAFPQFIIICSMFIVNSHCWSSWCSCSMLGAWQVGRPDRLLMSLPCVHCLPCFVLPCVLFTLKIIVTILRYAIDKENVLLYCLGEQ